MGYLKGTQHYALKLTIPAPGVGKLVHSDCEYVLESYGDSDWPGHKSHRRSTSASLHFLNDNLLFWGEHNPESGFFVFSRSRTPFSCWIVRGWHLLAWLFRVFLKVKVHHEALVGNSACKSLANKRGTGKIRYLSSKLLWIQERTADGSLVVSQVSTLINTSDLGTKPLTAMRLRSLLFLLGFVDSEDGKPNSKKVKQMANLMLRILAVGGLQGISKV